MMLPDPFVYYGEHVRSTPARPDATFIDQFIAGSSMPLTPLYAEPVMTLVYTTTFTDMYVLRSLPLPFCAGVPPSSDPRRALYGLGHISTRGAAS
jgi:hypothetical protein